jgi:hypothetical protein
MSPRLLNHFEQLDIGLLWGFFDKIVQFILHFPHGLSCNVTIANVIRCMCNTHNVPIWASSILDSLFCNGWKNETSEFVFTHHGKCDLVLICVDMTSEMSIAKGIASLSYLLLATCTLCHQGCTHFLNF